MRLLAAGACVLGGLVVFWPGLGCGGSPAVPSLVLHGEVADPAGDAPTTAEVPRPPDLVRATVDVTAGVATFALRFAPPFDISTTLLDIFVDTDQNANTGVPGDGMGADYDIGPAVVTRLGATSAVAGAATFVLLADGLDISVALAVLGGDDGRMTFKVRAHHAAQAAFDSMPDIGLAPARVQ